MPKKYLFYLIGIVFLAALGYYGYSKWTEAREKVDLWTLVPDDAVFVVESGNHKQFISRLKKTQVWESLADITYLRRFEENLSLMDSLAGGRRDLQRFLAGKVMLTSVHVESKTNFELVFYLPVSTVKEHRFLRTLGNSLANNKTFSQTVHEYEGFQITDLKNLENGDTFSHFSYRNNLILSQSSVLLEEIIRKIVHKRFESVAADYKNINYLNQDKVYANVFINYHHIPPFLNLFFKPELQPAISYLSGLCRNSMLEFRIENNKLFLNGFSYPEEASQSFFRHISQQAPQTLGMQEIMPNRTALLLHFGINKAAGLKQFSGRPSAKLKPDVLLLADTLSKTITGEVALNFLQIYNQAASPEKVVYARMAQPSRTFRLLDKIGRENGSPAAAFSEKYGRYLIKGLDVPELPALLFGKLFQGFEAMYYVQAQKYLLIADNPATLRSLIDDIEAEKTWGKTMAQKKFLEETQHETNFSLFINSVNAWDILNRYVKEENREGLLRNESLIKDFNQFSLQFSSAEKQFYTTVLLRQAEALALPELPTDTFQVENSVAFRSGLIAGPFPVKNPLNQSPEHIVQDSSYIVHCLASDGEIAWSDSLPGKIISKVIQAPLGTDGKTKYLFCTAQTIHCLDRKGNELPGFPLYMPDSLQLNHISIADWRNNGRFSLIAADAGGNLYQFNEFGDVLQGWEPKQLLQKLAAPPELVRVGAKNMLVAVLQNGYVYAINESGETMPAFPFSVKATVSSGFFGKPGATLRRSEFVLVTDKGEVVTFNLEGEITKRQQLVRPEKNARFELIPESNGNSYLIARQSLGRISLFNPEYRLLLERNFFTSSPKLIQYFLFGGDKIAYVITETGPKKTYLFNGKAQPIGNKTIESSQPVSLFYDDVNGQYALYKVFGKTFRKVILKN